MDVLVATVAVPATVAYLSSLLLGGRRGGSAAVMLFGVGLAAVLVAVGFVLAPSERTCSDCEEVLGRYVSPVFGGLLLLALVGWVGGSVVAAALRRAR